MPPIEKETLYTLITYVALCAAGLLLAYSRYKLKKKVRAFQQELDKHKVRATKYEAKANRYRKLLVITTTLLGISMDETDNDNTTTP